MKGVLLAVLLVLVLFFYACGVNPTISPAIGTAVAQTQTAVMWTPTVTPIVDPDVPYILNMLNESFRADDLEMTLDIRYEAVDVWFPYVSNGSSRIFHLDIKCVCAVNSHCCTPERTFVATMHAMKDHAEEIVAQIPDYIVWVDVACQNGSEPMIVMGAPWFDVKAYLLEEIDGSILGWRVTPDTTP